MVRSSPRYHELGNTASTMRPPLNWHSPRPPPIMPAVFPSPPHRIKRICGDSTGDLQERAAENAASDPAGRLIFITADMVPLIPASVLVHEQLTGGSMGCSVSMPASTVVHAGMAKTMPNSRLTPAMRRPGWNLGLMVRTLFMVITQVTHGSRRAPLDTGARLLMTH